MSRDPALPITRRVMNLSGILTQAATRFPDRRGLSQGDLGWTWREIEARVGRAAEGLRRLGVGKGDPVIVQSKNCLEMFESMFACFRIGAVWAPTNFRLTPPEVAEIAARCEAKAILCHAAFPEHAAALADALPEAPTVWIGGAPDGCLAYDALLTSAEGRTAKPEPVEYDDPCWFFFTSGSTAAPKAAVLTHGQMAFVIANHLADLFPGTDETDVSLVVAPLSHGAGVHQLVMAARGAESVLLPGDGLDPEGAWELVEARRVTNIFTVPTIVNALVASDAVDRVYHGSLKYVVYAGAPMYRADQVRALEKLGPVLVQYFGLGEVTGNITVLPPAYHTIDDAAMRVGSCGFARTGMQIAVMDEAGRALEPFETGEICVCGPAVFAGYHRNEAANRKAFRDGWFRTGDLGHLDAEGFLYITGRASDMYISGGSNIYPREIEEKLLTHPAVAECAVVGVPDPKWGEVGAAAIVLEPGTGLQADELLGWLDGRIARYKRPRYVAFWEALPKSGYGKVTKKAVREALIARGEAPQ
ncbi:MAG: acyl-CoA synthetase [Alphaproteobacteria bacterium]|nr:acyl-CoA synthetase [Alphaproteobacteria bacterium]